MTGAYAHLERERSRKVRDHTDRWNRLTPIGSAGDEVRAAIIKFCEPKRISLAALEALGARVTSRVDKGGLCLAYAGGNGNGRVVAIKYRPINGTSHDSFAEDQSIWLRPIIIGNRDADDWLAVEGETDAARLYDLVGGYCAILVLPLGARTFKPEWVNLLPRGATVSLCHDADEDGDAGAEKAAQTIPNRTLRVRPPVEGGDWCDWDGDAQAFLKLAKPVPRYRFDTYAEFAARDLPAAEPLLGNAGEVFLAVGSLLMVYGSDGSGKSTWTIDGVVHLCAGVDWLGIAVPRPVRVCVIENEGPPSLFQHKLRDKIAAWTGPDPTGNLFVYANPWGEFSFAHPEARAALTAYCDEHRIDVVVANPTLGLGVGPSGRPDETQQFVGWLVECGLYQARAFWLLHHENKGGQISGDWGRHPDTKVLLQPDGNRQRTKLTWSKTRWATLESEQKVVMLEWLTESWGYSVVKLGAAPLSDGELDKRINEFLVAHPARTTTAVVAGVEGQDGRIRARLNATFDYVSGTRGAKLWKPLEADDPGPGGPGSNDPGPGSWADGPGWEENPDE